MGCASRTSRRGILPSVLSAVSALLMATTAMNPWCSTASGADDKPKSETTAKATAEQVKLIRAAFAEFIAAGDATGREAAFVKIIDLGATAAGLVSPVIDNELAIEEGKYAKLLEPAIRSVYLKRLAGISDEQMDHIIRTRNLWKPYIHHGGSDPKFPEVFLRPIWKMKEILLPKISDIDDQQVIAARARVVEYADYQVRLRKVLGINPDPTVGRMSPTNIEYAHLDQPHAFADRLHHYERTLILINTVASPGAREVLLMNDQAAREIDVQEAEFVMASNEVRMLAGSIAWRADPLGCAVERDHSTDRKEGRASGHMSDVPGKHGFTDRNKRMGAIWYGSEGAGGGNNGPNYLIGLSYSGDGHGGPLYSLGCNVVGVGRRGGVYTSQYAFDAKSVHACPVTEQEVWMPPGISARDLRDVAIQEAYKAMKAESFASAKKAMNAAKAPPAADAISMRYFTAEIAARSQQAANDILAIEGSGDLVAARIALQDGLVRFKGIATFESVVAEAMARIAAKEARPELVIGDAYYRLYTLAKDLPKEKFDANRRDLIKSLESFSRKYPESNYGKAAAGAAVRLTAPEADAGAMLAYFRERRKSG